MMLFAFVGAAWAQTAATYADGVYKIYWQPDERGYLAYHGTDYPDNPQLAGVVNHNPNGHYALDAEGINLGWYLYTSQKTNKSYLFEATTGKFITIDLNTTVGNGKQCDLSEEVSVNAQFDLLEGSGDYTSQYLLRYTVKSTNYHFCSGCGSNKGQNPVRFSTDGQGDGGNRFIFVSEGVSIADDVKNAAIAKITAFEASYKVSFVDLTEDENAPVYYAIKNINSGKYATYTGDAKQMKLLPGLSPDGLFYFTEGTETANGQQVVKIHNYSAGTNLCAGHSSWTGDGIDWYIKEQANGYSIANSADASGNGTAWNNAGGFGKNIAYWKGPDSGSAWELVKYEGEIPTFKTSTPENIVLCQINPVRQSSLVKFDGHNTTMKQVYNSELATYWYFIVDAEEQAIAPAGVTACKIFTPLHETGLENHGSGFMGTDSYPAKVYYIQEYENNGYKGYAIYPKGSEYGWNERNGEDVCNYEWQNDGSVWNIYSTNKTMDEVKSEIKTMINNLGAATYVNHYAEADFYSVADDVKTAAQEKVTEVDQNAPSHALYATYLSHKAAKDLIASAEKTAGPAVGQYIQLKNRQYGKYLKPTDAGKLTSVADGNDRATLWLVVEGADGNVKLQNASTEKYIGQIRQSADVAMVEEADAKQFAFTNQADCYAVFKETSGGDYAYGHIAGHNVLVGWSRDANATQWIVSEVTLEESLADLQEIYDVVDNAFGDLPGQYKQSMQEVDEAMNTYVEGTVKPLLKPEAVVNAYTAKKTAATLKAQWDAVKTAVREINAPAQGKFYRLKNVASGNYMNGLGNEVKLLADGASVHTTIFYLGENNTLVSYNSGRYLDCSAKGYSAVGDAKSGAFAMAYDGAQANVITYKNNGYSTYGAGADGGNLDRGSNTPNHAGYNWILEEVTWLPIPVNVDAGYTTLYSPVELNPSYGGKARFEVYTVSNVSETYATLENKDVIPANTGVVLKLTDAGKNNIENGCVFLEINANGTNTATSVLLGTYADTYVADDAYVLGLVNGEVGFYTATKNQQDGASWLNNGFKAYLPKTGVAATLRFNFGGTTAIESVLNNGVDANAPIYDLSGRRVMNAVKGGIYIQNGKKFIVK